MMKLAHRRLYYNRATLVGNVASVPELVELKTKSEEPLSLWKFKLVTHKTIKKQDEYQKVDTWHLISSFNNCEYLTPGFLSLT